MCTASGSIKRGRQHFWKLLSLAVGLVACILLSFGVMGFTYFGTYLLLLLPRPALRVLPPDTPRPHTTLACRSIHLQYCTFKPGRQHSSRCSDCSSVCGHPVHLSHAGASLAPPARPPGLVARCASPNCPQAPLLRCERRWCPRLKC